MGEVFGKWELVKRLAAGGMGEVFLVRPKDQPDTEPAFVLKRVLGHLVGDQELKSLFLQEAGLVARLSHPHIARIHELGDVDGQWYLVMEYVEGKDLDRVLDAARQKGTPLPLGFVVRLVADAASALAAAHAATDAQGRGLGIVHGDVSPQNLLVSHDGVLKLIDFGIARTKQQGLADDSKALRGKYPYLAPEQVNDEEPDARADQFSLGAVAWELLTGRRLFEADTDVETLDLVAECDVPAPHALRADVPEALEKVVLRMLAKDKAARFASCEDVVHALDEVLSAHGWPAAPAALAAWLSGLFATARPPPKKVAPALRPVAEPPSTFVGRAAELATVLALVDSGAQVVTLVGPPGVGASRLAAQLARRAPPRAVHLRAEGIADVGSFCTEVLRALAVSGLEVQAEPTPVAVEAQLRAQGRLVLVVDGLDRLPVDARDAVRRWSDAARDVTVVGTAHAPLGWARERTFAVPPLAGGEAEALFRARAQLDALDEFERELVAKTGGSPLVVEWVAALYAAGAVEVVAEVLEGTADVARVLTALVDGLSPPQQAALAQLSVVEGTFSLEGAEATVDLSAFAAAPWVLDVLQGLQELALVETWSLPALPGEVRFRLHELVRERVAKGLDDAATKAAAGRYRAWLEGQAAVWREAAQAGSATARSLLALEGRRLTRW